MVVYHFTMGGRPKPAPRMTQRSKWYNTDYKNYKDEMKQVAMIAKCQQALTKIAKPAIWIEVRVATGNHGDWDNYAKTVCDALKGLAWTDDKAILFGAVDKLLVADKNEQGIDVWIVDRKDLASLLSMKLGKELTNERG